PEREADEPLEPVRRYLLVGHVAHIERAQLADEGAQRSVAPRVLPVLSPALLGDRPQALLIEPADHGLTVGAADHAARLAGEVVRGHRRARGRTHAEGEEPDPALADRGGVEQRRIALRTVADDQDGAPAVA